MAARRGVVQVLRSAASRRAHTARHAPSSRVVARWRRACRGRPARPVGWCGERARPCCARSVAQPRRLLTSKASAASVKGGGLMDLEVDVLPEDAVTEQGQSEQSMGDSPVDPLPIPSNPPAPEYTLWQKIRRRFYFEGVDGYTAKRVYSFMSDQFERPEWHTVCGIPTEFHNTLAIAALHMWMTKVRLMHDGEEGKRLLDFTFDAAWEDWEIRLVKWGVSGVVIGSKTTRLQQRVFGICHAFDYCWDVRQLGHGDEAFLGALWRNMYNAEDNVNRLQLEALFEYVKRELVDVMHQPQKQIFEGELFWGEPPCDPITGFKDLGRVREHRDKLFNVTSTKLVPMKRPEDAQGGKR